MPINWHAAPRPHHDRAIVSGPYAISRNVVTGADCFALYESGRFDSAHPSAEAAREQAEQLERNRYRRAAREEE